MEQRKTAVVYATRNGSTKRYAEWIARDCGADLIPLEEAVVDRLTLYETLVYGGCVYSGAIQGISFIKNNRDLLERVRLVVFTVGLTQPGDEAAFAQVLDRNFTEEERRGIRFCRSLGLHNPESGQCMLVIRQHGHAVAASQIFFRGMMASSA